MTDNSQVQDKKQNYGDDLSIKLQLNSIKNSRNSLNRIMRLYAAGKVSHVQFRNLVYAFSHLINFHKVELEQELLTRIEAIENKLENKS
jgi:hypothetical protein